MSYADPEVGNVLPLEPPGGAYQGYIIDRQGPSPKMTASVSEHDGSTPFTVTVDFFEPVWGFRVGDLQFNSDRTSVTLSSGSDGDSVYVLTVTPLNDTDRFVSVARLAAFLFAAQGSQIERSGAGGLSPHRGHRPASMRSALRRANRSRSRCFPTEGSR